jgi:inner membrane protein
LDPVTHTLAGVALGNAFFRDRVRKAAVIMAAASNLPDLDVLVHLSGSANAVLMRRTFGHSAFTIPLWAAGLTWLLKRTYCRDVRPATLYGMCLLGACGHVFLDLINSFGVVPLWPFSDWRPELSIVFIIDLILTGVLAAPLVLAAVGLRRELATFSKVSIGLAGVYFMLCGSARSMALGQLSEEAARLGVRPDFLYAFPEPLGPHRWRGVVRAGGIYRLYLMRPFSNELEPRDEIETAPDNSRVRLVRDSPAGRRLDWFFKAPVWTAKSPPGPPGSTQPWEVAGHDLRFNSLVLDWGSKGRAPFLFRFQVGPDGEILQL